MLSNPIEKIVGYLHEVGDPILKIAASVKHHYVVSEIETADAMCNRHNNCLQVR